MPADILGTTILMPRQAGTFTFHAGPVFTDLLLVDEINRMPPRTQAALLECMEERQVTSDGVRRPLPHWFTVFATQNPIDFEGTYPLPEAQLDRFLLKTVVPIPANPTSATSLSCTSPHPAPGLLEAAKSSPSPPACSPRPAAEVQLHPHRARAAHLHPRPRSPHPRVAHTHPRRQPPRRHQPDARRPGRSGIRRPQLLVPDDVKRAVPPVLRHRIRLKPEAELEGFDPDRILADISPPLSVPRA
jgi:MoxR-like ATPase